MQATNDNRNTTRARAEIQDNRQSLRCADHGDLMWPLTSEGAAAVRVVGKTRITSRTAHPSVPRTLCDADASNPACAGWVAEPLN